MNRHASAAFLLFVVVFQAHSKSLLVGRCCGNATTALLNPATGRIGQYEPAPQNTAAVSTNDTTEFLITFQYADKTGGQNAFFAINRRSKQVIAEVALKESPISLAIDSPQHRAFILANDGVNHLIVIDTNSFDLISDEPIDPTATFQDVLAIAPDGNTVLVGGANSLLHVIDAATLQELATVSAGFSNIAETPDENYILLSGLNGIQYVDTKTYALGPLIASPAGPIAISNDSATAYVAFNDNLGTIEISVLSIPAATIIRELPFHNGAAGNGIDTIALSPDQTKVFFTYGYDSILYTVELSSGSLTSMATLSPVGAISPDSSGGSLVLFLLNTTVLTAVDPAAGKVLWSSPTGSYLCSILPDPQHHQSYVFSNNSNSVASYSNADGHIRSVLSATPFGATPGLYDHGTSEAFAGGTIYAAGDYYIFVLNTATGEWETEVQLPNPPLHAIGKFIPSIQASPDGRTLCAILNFETRDGYSSEFAIFDVPSKTLRAALPDFIVSLFGETLAISSDSTVAYVTSANGLTKIDLIAGKVLGNIPVQSSGANFLIAISVGNATAYLLDTVGHLFYAVRLSDGVVIAQTTVGPSPTALAVDPDGTKVFIADSSVAALFVFDTASNQITGQFPIPSPASDLAFVD